MALQKAYIVLAHNNPGQLQRLLQRLADGNSWFFLHIDAKQPIGPFMGLANVFGERLAFVKRENGKWGGLGIVKATLNGLEQVCAHPVAFDYIHLMSGADYPLVSNATADAFFEAHKGKSFVEHFPFPVAKWQYGGMTRLLWYNFVRMQHYNRYKWYPLMLVNKFIRLFPFLRRRFPAYLKPYGGSQWWSITVPVARYILRFVKDHPDYLRFHRHTLLPDETFFQTILLNSQEEWLQQSLVNNNLRYIVWEKPGVIHFPLLLTMDDFPGIAASGKFWARKFDLNRDSEVFDRLDEMAGH
jgi:hypothetical protein